ncbi:MAG: hypothetical protein M0R80_04325 [Proteobacteria bacterium]|jgi:hypothetical protein|nr:hypothetical protein [Pseudomonadota bacterium]
MTSITIPVTPVVVSSIDSYISAYWTGLRTSLDAINPSLYTDLVANAAVVLETFDHDFLTLSQINQAQALLVCINASEFLSIGGNSNDKYYSSWKVYDRSLKKDIGMDPFTGAFCRLLKITFKEYTSKTSAARSAIYIKTKSNSVYLAPSMDQRAQVFKDYTLEDVATERKSYPLDNRFL